MPGFGKNLKKWITTSYDQLGLVILYSLLWSAVAAGLLALDQFVAHRSLGGFVAGLALIYILILSPLAAGVHVVVRGMITHDAPTFKDFLTGVREHLLGAWGLGIVQVLVTSILTLSVWFYAHFPQVLFKALAFLSFDLLFFWGMSSIYHFPLLIEQRQGIFKTIKKSALLALGGAAFTVGVFFVIILFTCLCVLSRILLPVVYFGMVSILQTLTLRSLLTKYGVLEPEVEPVDEGFHVG